MLSTVQEEDREVPDSLPEVGLQPAPYSFQSSVILSLSQDQFGLSFLEMDFEKIHKVIKHGDILALRKLLEDGLDPNLSNKYSWTLLMLVALEGNTLLGEELILRNADLNKRNDFGETALSLAAHQGHLAFVEVLLKRGASKECNPHGQSLGGHMTSSGLSNERINLILNRIANY